MTTKNVSLTWDQLSLLRALCASKAKDMREAGAPNLAGELQELEGIFRAASHEFTAAELGEMEA